MWLGFFNDNGDIIPVSSLMVAISEEDRPIHMEELDDIEAKCLQPAQDTQSSANM